MKPGVLSYVTNSEIATYLFNKFKFKAKDRGNQHCIQDRAINSKVNRQSQITQAVLKVLFASGYLLLLGAN